MDKSYKSTLKGESDFETRLFTGLNCPNPYEILEPPFCMEMTLRRIEKMQNMENIQKSLKLLKKNMKKYKQQ